MATNTTHTVRQLQRPLYAKAKQGKEGKLYSLSAKVWREDVLWEAWQQGNANTGAPGVDGQSIEAIGGGGQAGEMIRRVHEQRRPEPYRCHPVRRVDIPKPQGGTRPRGMAPVEARVVQTAMQLVLEPIFAADCHPCSYGYRPQRDAKMASLAIQEDLDDRAGGVVARDCHSYFTTIPHAKRMTRISQRVVDGSLLRLIKQRRKVSVAYHGQVEPTTVGVPQGAPLSPLSSHSSLNLVDQGWHTRGSPETLGATLHRSADDAILVCRTSAEPALQALAASAIRLGRTLHRDQTRITTLPEGLDFLGFHFVKRRSPTSGTYALDIFPSKAAQGRVRRRIKTCTKRRAPIAPPDCVQQVKQVGRGWGNSDRHPNASQAFRALQRCINGRFRRYLTCRSKGRGVGWQQSPNRALEARGLIYIGSRVIRYERAPGHARA
jgi:RNA-directed DNA polymerase